MDRILVVRLSSLGDILLATPALRALRKRFPQARMDFLTKAAFAPAIQGHPAVSEVLTLKTGTLSELVAIRKTILASYDLIVDLHRNLRSHLLTLFPGKARVVRYRKDAFLRRLRVLSGAEFRKNPPPVPLRYLEALSVLGVEDDGKGLDFYGSPEASARAEALWMRHNLPRSGVVALAPGAKWPTKEWPVERFHELTGLMETTRFVVLGSADEKPLGDRLAQARHGRVVNLTGETGIAEAGEILRKCGALVANDSGLMHLGCAAGIPVVALYGCTVKEFGFYPFRARSKTVEKELFCRPCSTKGLKKCPRGTLDCLAAITAMEVAEALQTL